MADDYTPSDGDVRARYVLAGLPDHVTSDQIAQARDREVPEFVRFLDRIKRAAKAEVLREIAPHLNDIGDEDYLLRIADQYEEVE